MEKIFSFFDIFKGKVPTITTKDYSIQNFTARFCMKKKKARKKNL
jgi:hypothetical protein